jgi:iron complex transport system permease protein
VRLPRVLVAFLVGAALGVSGAALQGLFHNPLADPSVLGVSAAAALFAQAAIFFGWANAWPLTVPLAASLGALLATLLLVALVANAGRGAIELLVLGGVALGQVASALSALLVSLAITDFSLAQRMLQWLLGSLDGRTWMHVFWGLGPVLAATAWLTLRARELDCMTLGEVTAASLGVDVQRLRRDTILATALLSGVAVAMGGIVGFVGLMAPHLLRRVVGPGHGMLVPGSGLGGGILVVVSDLLCRTLIAPRELQIGVVTAALGAPWFLVLLRRRVLQVIS